jgi:hypothetical protein
MTTDIISKVDDTCGLLLPPMRADLGWTYVEAGALNTANGAGYIVGALWRRLAPLAIIVREETSCRIGKGAACAVWCVTY